MTTAPAGPYRKILVPVDLSARGQRVVAAARALAGTTGEVALLHVIETIADIPFQELSDFYDRLEKRAYEELEELAAGFAPGAPVHREVVYGHRARSIVVYAEKWEADLIVLASHVVERERPVVTTISYQVAVLASCSVLLVK
jgi:nucleotide-binding universal stress UspA family protein